MAAGGDTQPNQGDQDGRMAVLRQDSGLEKKLQAICTFFFFFFRGRRRQSSLAQIWFHGAR